MTYSMTPEPDDPEFVTQFALDNPMPRELREQIGNWIEPDTVNTETEHSAAMSAISIAYPLIKAYLAEHPDELVVHD